MQYAESEGRRYNEAMFLVFTSVRPCVGGRTVTEIQHSRQYFLLSLFHEGSFPSVGASVTMFQAM